MPAGWNGPMEPYDLTDADEPLEAWAPEEFDHFTDLGLLRRELAGTDLQGERFCLIESATQSPPRMERYWHNTVRVGQQVGA